VLLRDDKSYPYIYVSDHAEFPRIEYFRGARKQKGQYFGPYPSAGAVRETLKLMQKIFKIRSCSDSFFKMRTRPCLQYQIKRCTAPCVDYISSDDYRVNVTNAVLFLEGKSQVIINDLIKKMEECSITKKYELASVYRDQIANIKKVQEKQYIIGKFGNVDVIAICHQHGHACISVITIRNGRMLGHKAHSPKVPKGTGTIEILSAFVSQYYLSESSVHAVPEQVIISERPSELDWLQSALSDKAGTKISVLHRVKGEKQHWLKMAFQNAEHILLNQLSDALNFYHKRESLQKLLKLELAPKRMECFDVSHTMGEATVASCVVFDNEGANKSMYRSFNIHGVVKGDDYGAIYQAVLRRYSRVKTAGKPLPDIIFIDGGKGQLHSAEDALEELQIKATCIIAVSKGKERKAGEEVLHISGESKPLKLGKADESLHLIQQIRDEAHRFAITRHKQKRAKSRKSSILETIEGVGAIRAKTLLQQFGGLQELKRASVEELSKVPGINQALAKRIFNTLRD